MQTPVNTASEVSVCSHVTVLPMVRRSCAAVLLLTIGCGRVGFERGADAGGDDAGGTTAVTVGTSFGTAAAAPGTVTVTLPMGLLPDDLLLLTLYSNQTGGAVTAATGWTTVLNQPDAVAQFHACFFERRVVAGEPPTYTFSVTSSLVAWALTAHRNAPVHDAETVSLLNGVPGPSVVTYTTPTITTTRSDEILVMLIDDSGSTTTFSWNDVAGATKIIDAQRVAVYTLRDGPGDVTFSADVAVPGTSAPHGAVRVIAW